MSGSGLCLNHLKRCQPSLKLSGFLLSLAMLLPCSMRAIAVAEENVAVVSDESTVPCKGLKPYNNLDELLYQLYINLDSDCLFNMSVVELEKVWGIKILDEERFKPKNYYPLSETEFYYKPYKTEKDAFYVEAAHDENSGSLRWIGIKITEEYIEKYGTLFPDEKLPKWLPEPNRYNYTGKSPPCIFPHTAKPSICHSPLWERSFGSLDLSSVVAAVWKKNFANNNALEKTQNNAAVEVVENDRNAPCRGLRPYKDIEDLLYQFYINLDSDCLFTMSLKELEEIWDTEIWGYEFGSERKKNLSYEDHLEFARKPCNTDRGYFYISATWRGGQIIPVINGKPSIDRFKIERAFCSKENGGILGDKDRQERIFRMLPHLEKDEVFSVWGWNSSDKSRRITFHLENYSSKLSHIFIFRTPEK